MYTNKKSSIAIFISIILFVTSGWYVFCYIPPYDGLIQKGIQPYIFAHRGLGDFAPDNSLVGATKAIKEGFYGVDVDAQYTQDKQVVIFHDLSVDRLTYGSGKIALQTLDDLKKLDLGAKYTGTGIDWNNSYVASFEDFVRSITPNGILMIELKIPTIKSTGMEEEIARIIEKYNAYDHVYLSSFNPLVLYRLKQIDPRLITAMISMDTNWNTELLAEIKPEDKVNLPWILQQEWARIAIRKIIQVDALSINHETNEQTIDRLSKKGYPIFLWTIDDPERIKWALQKHPHSIITDDPYTARAIITAD